MSRVRGVPSRASILCALSLALLVAPVERAAAVAVDSELVLLVDVSVPGLTVSQFDTLLDGYASAMTSSEVLDSIQSGATGQIALSLMFYGNSSFQQVGIPWMTIGNASDAAQFAGLAQGLNRPFALGFPSSADAIAAATDLFGTETGAAANGYESEVQIIEVAAAGINFSTTANMNAATAATANALGSGVDLINAISVGILGSIFESFYEQNVIGSTIPGVDATSGSSPTDATLAGTLSDAISDSTQTGADYSIGLIPEPTAAALLLAALGVAACRRLR